MENNTVTINVQEYAELIDRQARLYIITRLVTDAHDDPYISTETVRQVLDLPGRGREAE